MSVTPRHWTRLGRLAMDLLGANFRSRGSPFKLTLILNGRCNCRCQICSIWKENASGEMTLEEIERFFRKAPWFSWVNLSGGEIFLRRDIEEILLVVLERCPRLFLLDFPTTGQTPRRIEGVVRSVLRTKAPPRLLVTVSLDGPPTTHDRLRGVQGAFDRAVETFDRLRAMANGAFRPFFGFTLTLENASLLEETIASARRRLAGIGPGDFHLNLAHVSSHYYRNRASEGVIPGALEARRAVEWYLRVRPASLSPVRWLEDRYQRLLLRYLETGRTPLPCAALRASCFVDFRWNLYPCSIYDLKLTNLRDHDLDLGRALQSLAGLERIREEIREGRCPNCWSPCEAYQTILANGLRSAGS